MEPLTKAQQKLVTDNMGIAIRVLTRLNVRRGPGYDDCRSEAMLALVKAAGNFDPSRAGFSTWAWLKCTGAVKDWMDRESRRTGRNTVSEKHLANMPAQDPSPDEHADNVKFVASVRDALSPSTCEVVQQMAFGDMTIRQCASALKIKKAAIEETLHEARECLRCELDLTLAPAPAERSGPLH